MTLVVTTTPPEEKEIELKIPEEFYFSEQASEKVGANSVGGEAMALSGAPSLSAAQKY